MDETTIHYSDKVRGSMKMDGNRKVFMTGIILSIIFVVVGCVWFSNSAETLDEVAAHFGVTDSPLWTPPIPDYELPGFGGNLLAAIMVGIVFTMVILGVTFAVGKVLKIRG